MNQNIKPDYYRNNGTDLIEVWSKLLFVGEFRASMKTHIMKYLVRYEKKNGIEDLEKLKYYVERLIEFEYEQLDKVD